MNIFIRVYVKEMCVFVYVLLPHTIMEHVVANVHHLVVPVVSR